MEACRFSRLLESRRLVHQIIAFISPMQIELDPTNAGHESNQDDNIVSSLSTLF